MRRLFALVVTVAGCDRLFLDRDVDRGIDAARLDAVACVPFGGSPRQLLEFLPGDRQPKRTGDELYFARIAGGEYHLHVARKLIGTAEFGPATRLTGGGARDTDPALSFDGLRLVFVSSPPGRTRGKWFAVM